MPSLHDAMNYMNHVYKVVDVDIHGDRDHDHDRARVVRTWPQLHNSATLTALALCTLHLPQQWWHYHLKSQLNASNLELFPSMRVPYAGKIRKYTNVSFSIGSIYSAGQLASCLAL